jgi:ribosomal protein S18 acetylase RimI-like enzyme
LGDLFVEPDHRKRGIAQMLVARAAAHALDRGCPVIELTILKDNPLRRLYDRAGFQPLDSCVNYVASLEAMTVLAGAFSKAFENSAEATGLRAFEAAWAKSSNNNPAALLPTGQQFDK